MAGEFPQLIPEDPQVAPIGPTSNLTMGVSPIIDALHANAIEGMPSQQANLEAIRARQAAAAGPPMFHLPDVAIDAPEQLPALPPQDLPSAPAPAPPPRVSSPRRPAVHPPAGAGVAAPVQPPPFVPDPLDTAAAAQQQAGTEQVAAQQAAGGAQEQTQASEAAQAARAAQDEARLLEQQADARRKADAIVNARRQKAEAAKYHDFWEDKSTGKQVLVGLGIILGSVGRHPGQSNPALEVVNSAINRDFERQQREHADLFKSLEMAQQEGRDLSSQQLHELGAFRQLQAAKLNAVVKQGEAMASHSKNAAGVAELRTHLAKLGIESAKLQDEAHRATLAAVEKKRMDDSTIALHRSQAVENYAQAAHARAAGKVAENAGAEEKVAKLAAKMFPQQGNAVKAVKQAQEGEEIIKALRENPSSLQGALTKERLVSLFANGGRPSVVALQMVKKGAGSWADVAENDLMTALTGREGKSIRQNLIKVAETKVAEEKRAVENYRKQHTQALSGLEKRYPEAVQNYRAGIFGAEAQPEWKPITAALATKLPGKKEVLVAPDGSITGAR